MGEVEQLKPQPKPPEDVQAGVDVHFETTIGEGRVMRLSTTFFQGTPLEMQRAILRNVLSIADAEKAHYELQDLRWQYGLKAKGMARVEEDIARLDQENEKRKAEIEVEITALRGQQGERALAHEQAFRSTGRQGNFKRSASQQLELDNLNRDMSRLEMERAQIDGTLTNDRRDTMTALQRIKQDIGGIKEEIEKRLTVLGLPSEL